MLAPSACPPASLCLSLFVCLSVSLLMCLSACLFLAVLLESVSLFVLSGSVFMSVYQPKISSMLTSEVSLQSFCRNVTCITFCGLRHNIPVSQGN